MAIFMRKIQLYEPSSFYTISILPKLDFSVEKQIFTFLHETLSWFAYLLYTFSHTPKTYQWILFIFYNSCMNRFSTIYSEFQWFRMKIYLNFNSLNQPYFSCKRITKNDCVSRNIPLLKLRLWVNDFTLQFGVCLKLKPWYWQFSG